MRIRLNVLAWIWFSMTGNAGEFRVTSLSPLIPHALLSWFELVRPGMVRQLVLRKMANEADILALI